MSKIGKSKEHKEFSYMFFIFINGLISVFILIMLWITLPESIWVIQLQESIWKLLKVFLSMMLFNCLMEYFFHRYILHKSVILFLYKFYRKHTKHHGLTRIGKRRTRSGKEILFIIENKYPIIEERQWESSFFPWYTLLLFSVIITPLLTLLQWIIPSYPWFIGGNIALLASLTLYEFVHAIEHWDKERWDKVIELPRWGAFWRKVYSFHLRHHAVIDCNESISGFFTIPLADILFGTFVLPKSLYIDGGEWAESEFKSPTPIFFIKWFDEKAKNIVQKRRHRRTSHI